MNTIRRPSRRVSARNRGDKSAAPPVSLGAAPVALAVVPQVLDKWSASDVLLAASATGLAASLSALFVVDVRVAHWSPGDIGCEPEFSHG